MKKDTTALKVFQSIINQAKANLEELCNFWNIYEKQLFFVSAQLQFMIATLSSNYHRRTREVLMIGLLSTATPYSLDNSMM